MARYAIKTIHFIAQVRLEPNPAVTDREVGVSVTLTFTLTFNLELLTNLK